MSRGSALHQPFSNRRKLAFEWILVLGLDHTVRRWMTLTEEHNAMNTPAPISTRVRFAFAVLLLALSFTAGGSDQVCAAGQWLSGDFHHHTWLTDGNHTQQAIAGNAFNRYQLDWIASSEHGGTSKNDSDGHAFPSPVWRWITLTYYSYPIIEDLRRDYPGKLLIQGLEWNVPGHEHASVGIIADQPRAISNFEYRFDRQDTDVSRANEGLPKQNATHNDALAALKWLQENHPGACYVVINHPSRKLRYSAADLRDFNNAAPDAAVGFEGLPGHQSADSRGRYRAGPFMDQNGTDITGKARTYGGADYMLATVGGLWDALLGEGRRFWVFANSDFHRTGESFWPGEYSKSYVFASERSLSSLVDGLRSGNSFAVHGDLIKALDFRASGGSSQATMGEVLTVKKGQPVVLSIKYQSPAVNNHGDTVEVDHIDLIAGEVKGRAAPGTPGYREDTNETAAVIERFTTKGQKPDTDGWISVEFKLNKAEKDMYFRLRGTNLGLGVENETDPQGDPLLDDLMGTNGPDKAYKDLWFYSNPIFLSVNQE